VLGIRCQQPQSRRACPELVERGRLRITQDVSPGYTATHTDVRDNPIFLQLPTAILPFSDLEGYPFDSVEHPFGRPQHRFCFSM
jgi:hypothetical protein